jgi:hypothetical protein
MNAVGLIMFLFMALFIFPANFVLDTYGIRKGMLIFSIATIIGAWLRILVNKFFYATLISSVLLGAATPF